MCMFGGTGQEKASLPHSAWHISKEHRDISIKGIATESGCFFPTDLKSPDEVGIFQYNSSRMCFHLPNGTPGIFVFPSPFRNIPFKMLSFIRNAVWKCRMEKSKLKQKQKNNLFPFSKWREEQHTGRAGGDSGTRTIGSQQCNPKPGHNPSEAMASHEQTVVVVLVGWDVAAGLHFKCFQSSTNLEVSSALCTSGGQSCTSQALHSISLFLALTG